eukprot:TRINITY_DN49806_c0_g1_i1.p1 TRINITY_DN49806_c0_g1~~TRINITY_DN49806_c0_g1_i1.p1  ORF type:complete len:275 (+),score=90.56 TRINITY_DN49806_c0_g1_i1:148-972(+)
MCIRDRYQRRVRGVLMEAMELDEPCPPEDDIDEEGHPPVHDMVKAMLDAQEREEQDEETLTREYMWSPYNHWDAMDGTEDEEDKAQSERESALDSFCNDSPSKPAWARKSPDQEEAMSQDEFAKQVEYMKKMAAEARQAAETVKTPTVDRRPDDRVSPERDVGSGGDRDQVPQETDEQRGVSLEPLAEMLASMSLAAQEQGDDHEAAEIKQLERDTRVRQQQVELAAEDELAAEVQDSWQQEVRSHDVVGEPAVLDSTSENLSLIHISEPTRPY